jgi:hypothetical protein
MVVAATVGAGIAGSVISSSAAKSAANTQSDAATAAAAATAKSTADSNALTLQMYQQTLANNTPYTTSGQQALSALSNGLGLGASTATPTTSNGSATGTAAGTTTAGTTTNAAGQLVDASGNIVTTPTTTSNYGATQDQLNTAANTVASGSLTAAYTPSDLTTDPSYTWRLAQGQKALASSAAAKGGTLSGQNLIDINNYAQGAASTEYAAANDRYVTNQNNLYTKLSGLAGLGQTATTADNTAGTNAASTVAATTTAGTAASNSELTSAAAAQAAGTVGSANAWNSALNNTANTWTTLQLLGGTGTKTAGTTGKWDPVTGTFK